MFSLLVHLSIQQQLYILNNLHYLLTLIAYLTGIEVFVISYTHLMSCNFISCHLMTCPFTNMTVTMSLADIHQYMLCDTGSFILSWILLIIIQFSPSIVERCNLTVPVGERLPRALPTTRLHTWTRIPYDDFTLLPHAADYTTTGAVSSDCIIYMAKLSCSSSELSDAYF